MLRLCTGRFDFISVKLSYLECLFHSNLFVSRDSGRFFIKFGIIVFSILEHVVYAAGKSDKETALKTLVEHNGIDLSDVIAFGDDINDLGMLKLAGTAVAVSNAIDEVKAVADHITESNDQDGVAKFLDRIILA